MGGIPHTTRDANSRERAKRSEGSAKNRDEETWKTTDDHPVA
jgi:hypothetical protein